MLKAVIYTMIYSRLRYCRMFPHTKEKVKLTYIIFLSKCGPDHATLHKPAAEDRAVLSLSILGNKYCKKSPMKR